MIERAAKGFARRDIAVYATALAYRGLFALLPFAVFLVAVLSFLRMDAVLVWLAEQGLRARFPMKALNAVFKVDKVNRTISNKRTYGKEDSRCSVYGVGLRYEMGAD